MTEQRWTPLSRRQSAEPEALYEGAPPHLKVRLLEWLRGLYDAGGRWKISTAREHRRSLALRLRIEPPGWSELESRLNEDSVFLLDAVDASLGLETSWLNENRMESPADAMEDLLREAGSAWRVSEDNRSLERRVDATATEAVARAAPPVTNAAGHLAAAWQAAYGLHPDLSNAYREAVRAVEAAAIQVFVPDQAKATLGHVLGELKADLQRPTRRWELAILGPDRIPRDVGPLVAMLELLWQGHCDRHPGPDSVPMPPDAAPMAVHLAATMVQWFTTGAVRRHDNRP
jgi:hypothetical protein